MNISQRGIDLILKSEGKKTKLPDGRYKAYLDTLAKPPVWTVYCGLTRSVTKDTVITVDDGERMFAKELAVYEDAVERLVKVPLNQHQFDALVSFTYNCGAGEDGLAGSTLLKVLNQGKYDQVPAQLKRWKYAGGVEYAGLVTRRAAEAALFMKPMSAPASVAVEEGEDVPIDQAIPQRVEPAAGSVREAVATSWTIRGAATAIGGAFMNLYNWALSGAQEAGAEAAKLNTSFGPWEALFVALKANLPLLAAGFVVAGCGIVIIRRLSAAREGRIG
jgi:lysozyme